VNRIEENSKIYHQNFLLCNNDENEITACVADLRSVRGCISQGSAATNYR